MMRRHIILIGGLACLLVSCSSPKQQRHTLRDIDISGAKEQNTGKFIQPKSDQEIREAYANYLKHASINDRSRVVALNRLAQLEFELSEKTQKTKAATDSNNDSQNDKVYDAKLEHTIELLSTAIRDYPDAEGNDNTLYQLAKAYDQKGDYASARSTLVNLTTKYQKSPHFVESLFRLAEDAFSAKNYTRAEDLYTEIIGNRKNQIYYEKAIYKRGWSRFKQEFYQEAIDDFLEVVKHNKLDDYHDLEKSRQQLFDEYFRAIGLSFLYLGGADSIHDYFKDRSDFSLKYYVYLNMSNIYVKQERFNDAIDALAHFSKANKDSDYVPEAALMIIDILQMAGYKNRINDSVQSVYDQFNPDSQYWHNKKNVNARIYKLVAQELRKHMLTVTANHHQKYNADKSPVNFNNAQVWYKRYLKHYSAYSRKDNIHYLYASLLAANKMLPLALYHFEQAGFDDNIITSKEAAYESILLSAQLNDGNNDDNNTSTRKVIEYSMLYSQQYPNDKHTPSVLLQAVEVAYKRQMYDDAIQLAELYPNNPNAAASVNINLIKGHSYFRLGKHVEAENIYSGLLQSSNLSEKYQSVIKSGLASSIFQQAKNEAQKGNVLPALQTYARISDVAPDDTLAASGMLEAINLGMEKNLWPQSIQHIKRFQALFPNHAASREVAKKLSVAYLNSKQDIAAARELEKISSTEEDQQYKQAALWKAGELYESRKDITSAIRSYEHYSKSFPTPYPQNMEAMYKLTALYAESSNLVRINFWHAAILHADKKVSDNLKTDRTRFIASTAALSLAKAKHLEFDDAKLSLPLKASLHKKKQAMQESVNLYGRASSYGVLETATEATYAIATIYYAFNRSLLASERPKHLNPDELEQYQILLEDQAFPFEEKAIEFHETNLAYVKEDIYDEWVKKSHLQLKQLFPVRYNREFQLDAYINVLH